MTINDNANTSISNRRTLRATLTKPLLLIAGAALVAGCTTNNSTDTSSSLVRVPPGGSAAVTAAASPADVTADLAGITKKNVAKIAPTRLAEGLVPPTNRWFSGLVFNDQPQPVFPMPLSVAETDTGFGLGLPTVTASEKTIMGGNNPQIQVPLGAAKMQVTAYDTLSVTSTYSDASGAELGSVKLVQGSPFVTYTAAADQTIALEPVFKPGATADSFTTTVAGHEYGLVVGGGATVDASGAGDPEVRVDHDALRGARRCRRCFAGQGRCRPDRQHLGRSLGRRGPGQDHAELRHRQRRGHRHRADGRPGHRRWQQGNRHLRQHLRRDGRVHRFLADHHGSGHRAVRRARPVEPVRRGQDGPDRADQDRRGIDRLRCVRHRYLLRRQDGCTAPRTC